MICTIVNATVSQDAVALHFPIGYTTVHFMHCTKCSILANCTEAIKIAFYIYRIFWNCSNPLCINLFLCEILCNEGIVMIRFNLLTQNMTQFATIATWILFFNLGKNSLASYYANHVGIYELHKLQPPHDVLSIARAPGAQALMSIIQ